MSSYSEQDYRRLYRQVKLHTVVSFVLILPLALIGGFQALLAFFAFAALLYIYNVVWMRLFLLRGLQPSDEALSLQDSIPSQARARSASTTGRLMGYFDALTSACFKTAQDGRKLFFPCDELFFPWGYNGRGYVIASEQEYQRLHRQVKLYTVVSLVLNVSLVLIVSLILIVGASGGFQAFLAVFAIAPLLNIYYRVVWMRLFLLRGLQPSDETLSWQDANPRVKEIMSSPVSLLGSLFLGLGIAMLAVIPVINSWNEQLGGIVGGIAFFGIYAAVFMLVMLVVIGRMSSRARELGLASLWLLQISSLAFVGGGIFSTRWRRPILSTQKASG